METFKGAGASPSAYGNNASSAQCMVGARASPSVYGNISNALGQAPACVEKIEGAEHSLKQPYQRIHGNGFEKHIGSWISNRPSTSKDK